MAFMDKFLFFWTHYNTQIVQGVIAIILLMVTFLVWGALISPKTASHEEGASAGHGGGTEEIERMLKKLMEDQASRPAMIEGAGASIDPASLDAAVAAQVETYKKGIADKEAMIKQLEVKIQEAEKAAANAAAAPGDGGNSKELEEKLKNLEARLQEYEIIAEDISDLAKFREENAKLNKELEALKSAKPAAAAPAAPAAEPAPAAAPAAPAPAEVAAAPTAPAEEAAPAAAAAPAEAAAGGTDFSIDDELMKEFAAAVEGQKTGSLTDGKEPPQATNEEGELMGKFGEFVAKKP